MDAVLLYITAPNREEAISVARDLVNSRAVACANIIEHATALYWWQGRVEQESEVLIVAKTMAGHVEKVTARVKAMHEYDVPCVVAVPITGGNPDYLAWIEKETTQPAG
jgi:periplasmic divalent cation tolerance protein